MAPILVRASGWSGPLRRILPALAAGHAVEDLGLARLVGHLRSAAEAAIRCGAPTMILNVVRTTLETALNEAGPFAAPDALFRFYERCSGVALTPTH